MVLGVAYYFGEPVNVSKFESWLDFLPYTPQDTRISSEAAERHARDLWERIDEMRRPPLTPQ
jgi:hypothetical protein